MVLSRDFAIVYSLSSNSVVAFDAFDAELKFKSGASDFINTEGASSSIALLNVASKAVVAFWNTVSYFSASLVVVDVIIMILLSCLSGLASLSTPVSACSPNVIAIPLI